MHPRSAANAALCLFLYYISSDQLTQGGVPLQCYLSVTPAEVSKLSVPCTSLAHVAYRIGPGSTLLRQNLLLQTKGGLLSVSDRDMTPVNDPQALCAAVLRECSRRSYNGVVLDFESVPRRDLLEFAQQLSHRLNRRLLFVPESYAPQIPGAIPLICTALSGGDLAGRLQQAISAYPGRRLALDVQRLRMDFTLPAPTGQGQFLTGQALQALIAEKNACIFFSPALCTRYFTYTQNGAAHFVLFDDAETLRQKLQIGTRLGFCAALFQWPEIQDLLSDLHIF